MLTSHFVDFLKKLECIEEFYMPSNRDSNYCSRLKVFNMEHNY